MAYQDDYNRYKQKNAVSGKPSQWRPPLDTAKHHYDPRVKQSFRPSALTTGTPGQRGNYKNDVPGYAPIDATSGPMPTVPATPNYPGLGQRFGLPIREGQPTYALSGLGTSVARDARDAFLSRDFQNTGMQEVGAIGQDLGRGAAHLIGGAGAGLLGAANKSAALKRELAKKALFGMFGLTPPNQGASLAEAEQLESQGFNALGSQLSAIPASARGTLIALGGMPEDQTAPFQPPSSNAGSIPAVTPTTEVESTSSPIVDQALAATDAASSPREGIIPAVNEPRTQQQQTAALTNEQAFPVTTNKYPGTNAGFSEPRPGGVFSDTGYGPEGAVIGALPNAQTLGYNTAPQGISFASPEQIAAYRAPKEGTKAWYDAMGPGQADLVNQIGSIQGANTGDMRAASRLVDDGRGGYKRVADGGLAAQAAKAAAISPLAKALAELRGEQLSAEGEDRRTSAGERNAALVAETAQGQTAALERNAALTARTAQQQLAENRRQFGQVQGLTERKHLADEAERAEASRLAAQEQTGQQNMLDLGSRGSIPLPDKWKTMSDAERAEWIEWGHLLGDNSVLPESPK